MFDKFWLNLRILFSSIPMATSTMVGMAMMIIPMANPGSYGLLFVFLPKPIVGAIIFSIAMLAWSAYFKQNVRQWRRANLLMAIAFALIAAIFIFSQGTVTGVFVYSLIAANALLHALGKWLPIDIQHAK